MHGLPWHTAGSMVIRRTSAAFMTFTMAPPRAPDQKAAPGGPSVPAHTD